MFETRRRAHGFNPTYRRTITIAVLSLQARYNSVRFLAPEIAFPEILLKIARIYH